MTHSLRRTRRPLTVLAQFAVDLLTLSLLANAFRDEVVTQDPANEHAAELLRRLAAQREAAPTLSSRLCTAF